MIPEPQRTYILELLKALGPAADDFVVADAQAMKFFLERARATKDIDFVLDVVGLRGEELSIRAKLHHVQHTINILGRPSALAAKIHGLRPEDHTSEIQSRPHLRC